MQKLFLFICFGFLFSHKIENEPFLLTQPNGSVFECFASGDQYYHWLHDENGYSIIQKSFDGYYYYAIEIDSQIEASNYLVDSVNPEAVGLVKNIIISQEEYLRRRELYWGNLERRDAPSLGTINNINVFINQFFF